MTAYGLHEDDYGVCWLRGRLFVPDREDLEVRVGPFASREAALEAQGPAERGVLHLTDPGDG